MKKFYVVFSNGFKFSAKARNYLEFSQAFKKVFGIVPSAIPVTVYHM